MTSVSMSREKSQLPTMVSVNSAGIVPPISDSSAPRSSARFARRGRSILPLKQPPTSGRSPGSPSLSATCQAANSNGPLRDATLFAITWRVTLDATVIVLSASRS